MQLLSVLQTSSCIAYSMYDKLNHNKQWNTAHFIACKAFIIRFRCDVPYTHRICFLTGVLWISHTLQVMNLLSFDVSNTVLSLSSSYMPGSMLIDLNFFTAHCSGASPVCKKLAGGRFNDADLCVYACRVRYRRTSLDLTAYSNIFLPPWDSSCPVCPRRASVEAGGGDSPTWS